MLGLRRETLESSKDFAIATSLLEDIASKTNLVIAYAPQREAVYWQYLSEQDKRWAYDNLITQGFTLADGWLESGTIPPFDEFAAHVQDQRDTWAAWANEAGIQFVDLTPVLQRVLEAGELPYNVVDAHWNEAGHTAVGLALAGN
jgi:hypothetical protein